MTPSNLVLSQLSNNVLTLKLNRPQRANAFVREMSLAYLKRPMTPKCVALY